MRMGAMSQVNYYPISYASTDHEASCTECHGAASSIWENKTYCDAHNPTFMGVVAVAALADLHARLLRAHQDNQRLIHENERLRASVREEVIAAASTWGLEVQCDGKCGVNPLRIKVLPPEDAIPGWIRGQGWLVTGEGHWCGGCASEACEDRQPQITAEARP
jgi:hypothetical protein